MPVQLSPMAAAGAGPAQVADAAMKEWQALHAALSTVIGPLGSASLYRRVLHLARDDRPWLAGAYMGQVEPGDFSSLHEALLRQDSVIAAGAHDEMLRSLRELLANLIGAALTERVLAATSAFPSAGNAVQDSLQ